MTRTHISALCSATSLMLHSGNQRLETTKKARQQHSWCTEISSSAVSLAITITNTRSAKVRPKFLRHGWGSILVVTQVTHRRRLILHSQYSAQLLCYTFTAIRRPALLTAFAQFTMQDCKSKVCTAQRMGYCDTHCNRPVSTFGAEELSPPENQEPNQP